MTPIRLCLVVNPGFALTTCYGDQFDDLQARGFAVTTVAGPDEAAHAAARARGVATHAVAIARYPHPWRDLRALAHLWAFFRRHEFDVIQVSTPKASLLGALAARLAGRRHLVYLVRGRAYECERGLARRLHAGLDALCCQLADVVVPVSASLAWALRDEGICPAAKLRLIGDGSSRGVDLAAFAPTPARLEAAQAIRRGFGLGDDDVVALFVGWVRREKGIVELVEAMRQVRTTRPGAHLVVVGDPHDRDDLPAATRRDLCAAPGIHWQRRVADTAPYYLAADLVAVPSWREGLPRVVLEAAAAGKPVIATRATGCHDAVVDGETGVLVPARDAGALAVALGALLDDPGRRRELGGRARAHVAARYAQAQVWAGHAALLREVALGLAAEHTSALRVRTVETGGGAAAPAGLVDELASVHLAAFPGFFLTRLGRRFVREYYRTLVQHEGGLLVVAERDGRVVGFAAGALAPAQFYAFLRRRAARFLIPAALGLARRPGIARAASGAVGRTVGRAGDRAEASAGDGSELASLAVLPACAGQGVGRLLVDAFCDRARAAGARRVVLTTDAEGNDRVNRFYRGLGFAPGTRETRRDGRVMQHYARDLGP